MMRSFLACLVSWVLLVGFSGWGTAAENGDDENLLREAGIGTDGPALLRFLPQSHRHRGRSRPGGVSYSPTRPR